jgi:uncharacterized protein YgbK (DUF1537 family)
MILVSRKGLAALVAGGLAFQPTLAAAQQTCVTETEVSAVAIYSVPSIIQAVRNKCGRQLTSSGYLARNGDSLSRRYAALQGGVWPRAKSGLLKVLARQTAGAQGRQTTQMLSTLPDDAVRPLVDALIVQEVQAKVQASNCTRIEWVIEAIAPIDPDIAGKLIGTVVGLVDPEQMPICARR